MNFAIQTETLRSRPLPLGDSRKCLLLERFLEPRECKRMIETALLGGFRSPLSHYPPSYRNNQRLVIDSDALAAELYPRLQTLIPEFLTDGRGDLWRFEGINPRFRFCRYEQAQAFFIHQDGVYYRSPQVRSFLTLLIYLNGAPDFQGGSTRFFARHDDRESPLYAYAPRAGDALVFDHRIWHDGAEILTGEKYVLRSDLLYRRVTSTQALETPQTIRPHQGYIWDLILSQGRVFSGGRDGRILVSKRTGDQALLPEQELLGHENSVTTLCSVHGKIWSGSRDQTIRIWRMDSEGKYSIDHRLDTHASTVLHLVHEPNTGRVISSDAQGQVLVWSESGQLLHSIRAHANWAWKIAILDAQSIATCGEDGSVRAWDLETGALLAEIELGNIPIWSLAACGTTVFAGDRAGTIHQLKIRRSPPSPSFWKKVRTFETIHTQGIRSLNSDGEDGFFSAGEDGMVFQCRIKNDGAISKTLIQRHENFATCVVISNGVVYSSSYDGTLKTALRSE